MNKKKFFLYVDGYRIPIEPVTYQKAVKVIEMLRIWYPKSKITMGATENVIK
jgi:biotin synthase-like enzyme